MTRLDLSTGALGLFGRVLLIGIGIACVIPAPWATCWFATWFTAQIRVDDRRALTFAATPGSIAVVAVAYGLLSVISGISENGGVDALAALAMIPLGWGFTRWFVDHLQLGDRRLRFDGDVWPYVGWTLLIYVSVLTIIGWAWAIAAFYRWIAAHVRDAGGDVTFTAPGHEVLWRTIVFVLFCIPIVTMPWSIRWIMRWWVRQFAVASGMPDEERVRA